MQKIFEIKDLSFSIDGKKILDNINLFAQKNKITGMIGGSGSGKTTLIKTILNIQIPETAKISGSIKIMGEISNNQNRRLIQPVFQDPASYFNPSWDLLQCLSEPLNILSSYSTLEKRKQIRDLLDEFSIPEKYLNQSIRRFSGGELQRISIMRAILCKPEILLMDEPVSGLDPLIQRDAIRLIKELNIKKRISIFLISHDIDFISELCDFIYVIQNGKIVEKNNKNEILKNPTHGYTKQILHSRDLSTIKN